MGSLESVAEIIGQYVFIVGLYIRTAEPDPTIAKEPERHNAGKCLKNIKDCVEMLITLMGLRGTGVLVIDGVDECEEPMKLLKSLHKVWEKSPELKVLFNPIFQHMSTVRSI